MSAQHLPWSNVIANTPVETLVRRLRAVDRDHPRIVDVVIAVAVTGYGLLTLASTIAELHGGRQVRWWWWVVNATVVLPLALRRRFPITVLVYIGAVTIWMLIADVIPDQSSLVIGLWLALETAGSWGGRGRSSTRTAFVASVMAIQLYYSIKDPVAVNGARGVASLALNMFSTAFLLGLAWVFGDIARARRSDELTLRERNAQLVTERGENAKRAVLDERVRIARELHDVVAHHVSVMGIQAAAARRVLTTRPGDAVAPIEAIEVSARQAVSEMQRLLGFLRQADDEDSTTPQPDLSQLPALLDEVRSTGLRVDAEMVRPNDLGTGLVRSVELAAFRIVQEALTNVLKHASATRVTVVVCPQNNGLSVKVTDNGLATSAPSPGHGLSGMRERVALHGGTLQLSAVATGGLCVDAHLHIDESYIGRS